MAEEQKDNWQFKNLGDIGSLNDIFDAFENAATVNRTALDIVRAQYEAGKVLALAAVNPLFFALNEFITLIDDLLKDLANSGYFTLMVNQRTMPKKSNTNPVTVGRFTYQSQKRVPAYRDTNGELVGAIRNKTVPDHPPLGSDPSDTTQFSVTEFGTLHATDSLGTHLYKLVPNYESVPSGAAGSVSNISTGLIEATPSDIIQTMIEAFSDEGDLKKEFLDKNNESVATWESASVNSDGQINYRLVDNKPTFSSESSVGGFVIIVGASTVTGFTTLWQNITSFFDISEYDDLLKDLSKITHIPQVKVNVKDVHKIGKTDSGDEITQASNFTQWVASKKDDENMVLIEQSPSGDSSYTGFVGVVKKSENLTTPQYFIQNENNEKINTNILPYVDEELTLQPLTRQKRPTPGNNLVEAEVQTNLIIEDGSGANIIDLSPNSTLKEEDGEEMDLSSKNWQAKKPKRGETIFTCKVKHNLQKPKSTPPDFKSRTLSDLIPALGTLIRDLRSKLNYYRGIVTSAADSIQPTIDAIDKRFQKLEDISNTIITIQEQIAALRNIGVYILALDPQPGGTDNFISRLQEANQTPSNTLKFSAGYMFVAGSPDVKNAEAIQISFDTLKELFGV